MASWASSSDWSATFEIGAAILLVGVEEEPVEPAVEVVMMRDIAPRPRAQIELLHAAEQVAHRPRRQRPFRRGDLFLPHQDRQHVRDRALLDDESAVHVGFAQPQLGIEQDRALRRGVGKAHGDRRAAAVAECVAFARCRRDRQGALADKPPQEQRQQPIQRRLHAATCPPCEPDGTLAAYLRPAPLLG